MIKKRFGLLIWLSILSGCQTLPLKQETPISSPLSFAMHQKQLIKIHTWELNGKIGLQDPHHAWHGTFTWQQTKDTYQLACFGPLGMGGIHIKGQGNQVRLTDSQNHTIETTPDNLLKQVADLPLSLNYLFYWIKGLPQPNSQFTYILDKDNHITHLNQAGWEIYFQNYQLVNKIALPTNIILKHPSFTIHLIINKWDISMTE